MSRGWVSGGRTLAAMAALLACSLALAAATETATDTSASADSSASDAESTKGIQCYRCGITDECPHPWVKDNITTVECGKSCMKFDGYTKDDKRLILMDCGYFETDGCIREANFQDSATGSICHCMDGDECNAAGEVKSTMMTLTLAVTFVGVVTFW